jgi:hypothetical protein
VSVGAASLRAVPTPADHFRAWLDRPASAAGDPTADRVRRAMAGESPARFRDRLLLERAAHLVTATDRTLQSIADECGFRGYDVFTRAFRRELGALPSQWRGDPTSWAIDAPGEVHFQPPDGLRLPARRRTDSVDLVVEMVEHHVRVVGDLLEQASRLHDDDLHRPADGGSLRSVLARSVERMEELTSLVHEVLVHEVPPEAPADASVAALRARLAQVGPDLVAAVAVLGATGRFDEAFVDAFSADPVTVSFGEMVTRMVTDADDLLLVARTRLR